MVACDNRTSDSAIPPGLFWPCILMPEEKEVQIPGNLSSKGADLFHSRSATYVTFSLQESGSLILELPFCFPETLLSLHFTLLPKKSFIPSCRRSQVYFPLHRYWACTVSTCLPEFFCKLSRD